MSAALPDRRRSVTVKDKLGGMTVFMTFGFDSESNIKEVFIDLPKVGSAMRTILSCFGMALSLALRHGASIPEICSTFRHTHFEPATTEYRSIIDLVVQRMEEVQLAGP